MARERFPHLLINYSRSGRNRGNYGSGSLTEPLVLTSKWNCIGRNARHREVDEKYKTMGNVSASRTFCVDFAARELATSDWASDTGQHRLALVRISLCPVYLFIFALMHLVKYS